MDNEKTMNFYRLLEKLIRQLTDLRMYDRHKINETLTELCIMFRISKGETLFYESRSSAMTTDAPTVWNGPSAS